MPSNRLVGEPPRDSGHHLLGGCHVVRVEILGLLARRVLDDRLTRFRLRFRRLCQRGGRGADHQRNGRTESEQAPQAHGVPFLPVPWRARALSSGIAPSVVPPLALGPRMSIFRDAAAVWGCVETQSVTRARTRGARPRTECAFARKDNCGNVSGCSRRPEAEPMPIAAVSVIRVTPSRSAHSISSHHRGRHEISSGTPVRSPSTP